MFPVTTTPTYASTVTVPSASEQTTDSYSSTVPGVTDTSTPPSDATTASVVDSTTAQGELTTATSGSKITSAISVSNIMFWLIWRLQISHLQLLCIRHNNYLLGLNEGYATGFFN